MVSSVIGDQFPMSPFSVISTPNAPPCQPAGRLRQGVQLFAEIADISLVGNLAFSNSPRIRLLAGGIAAFISLPMRCRSVIVAWPT
ncbi:hypothetical protein SLE2022_320180 [Rubroshorea leprosula]